MILGENLGGFSNSFRGKMKSLCRDYAIAQMDQNYSVSYKPIKLSNKRTPFRGSKRGSKLMQSPVTDRTDRSQNA